MATNKPQIHTESGPVSENGAQELDSPTYRHPDDMTAEEKQAIYAQHRAKKADVHAEAQELLAKTYEGTRGFRSIDKTVDVPCPIEGYEQLTFKYKVNLPAWKRAEMRPYYIETNEILDLDEYIESKSGKKAVLDAEGNEIEPAVPPSWANAQEAQTAYENLRKLRQEFTHNHIKQWCEWVALFVVGVRGWNEARPVGVDAQTGEEIMEAIPAPSRFRPESFQVIYDEMSDLANWLEDDGYATALKNSQSPDFS